MGEWKATIVGEIAEIEMGQSPNGETCNIQGIGKPLLNGPTEFGLNSPKAVQYTTNSKRECKPLDILFCVRGSTTGRMNWADKEYSIGRGLAAIRHKNGAEFRYFLRGLIEFNLNLLLSSATGSTFPNVTKMQIESIEIKLPSLQEQRAIASILSSLDDKIDLLHRQNQTLEKMAETLFRQWFVEEAKEDWKIEKLGKIIIISSGKGLKKDFLKVDGIYPVLGANGPIGRSNQFLYNDRLIYTGRVGTLGNIFRLDYEKVWLTDNTLVIRVPKYYNFVYFTLKNSKIEDYNVGSTQPLIRQSDIKEIEFVFPNSELINEFEMFADKLYEKINTNNSQISTLATIRDTLLPKLMSGEVRVSET